MYIFIDEAGDLSNFSATGSKYFLLVAVVAKNHEPANAILDLRHDLERESFEIPRGFHAKNDPKPRRNRVFECLKKLPIELHVVAIRKENIFPHLRASESWMYGFAFKKIVSSLSDSLRRRIGRKRLVLPTYSTGSLRKQIVAVCRNTIVGLYPDEFEIAFWESSGHAGLQIADYCSWAIQRKLERGETESLEDIKTLIEHVVSPWESLNDL